MAEEFKWIANKQSLVGTPLEDQFPNIQGLNTNTIGFGFNGWPKAFIDLDVTNYEVVNTYELNDLLPFYWNWKSFNVTAQATIPLEENSADKDSVDLNVGGTYQSGANREPKDRVDGAGFSYAFQTNDSFNLANLETGIVNPEYDPSLPRGPDNEFWLREPNETLYCKARVRFGGGGINTIYRCYSGGNFIGYSFKDLVYTYAKSSAVSTSIQSLNVKLIGWYGLIEDIDDLIYDLDPDIADIMNELIDKTTNTGTLTYGDTTIYVTVLNAEVEYEHFNLANTPEGNVSAFIGIDGPLTATASLGDFGFHTYA